LTLFALALIFLDMEIYRPLRGALLIYECIRLLVLAWVFVFFRPGDGAGLFPWLVYAVPNALFPLMALFVWRHFSRYAVYVPLYISGKCIALASLAGFWLFSRQHVYTALALKNPGVFTALGSLLFLLAGDLFAAAGGLALARKIPAPEGAAGVPAEAAGEGGGR
jgi:hypothetical protein